MKRFIVTLIILCSLGLPVKAMPISDDSLIHLPFGYGFGITSKVAGWDDTKIRVVGYSLCVAKEITDQVRGSYFDVCDMAWGMVGVEMGLRAGNWAINVNPHLIEVSTLW